MEKLSNLISKSVVTAEEGISVGYVLNVCFDGNSSKLSGLLICDEGDERINFLDLSRVKSINDFVVISSVNDLEFGEMIKSNNPVGKIVLSEKGEVLGRVYDVLLEGKKLKKILINNGEIIPQNILNFDGDYLFFNRKKRKSKTEKKFPRANDFFENKVEIQENITKNKNISQDNKKQNNYIKIPFKSTISFQDILGKMATMDILGYNNEIIVRKNQTITNRVLEKAKKHNKANLLLFNSK